MSEDTVDVSISGEEINKVIILANSLCPEDVRSLVLLCYAYVVASKGRGATKKEIQENIGLVFDSIADDQLTTLDQVAEHMRRGLH